jgi:hypothetical protein
MMNQTNRTVVVHAVVTLNISPETQNEHFKLTLI